MYGLTNDDGGGVLTVWRYRKRVYVILNRPRRMNKKKTIFKYTYWRARACVCACACMRASTVPRARAKTVLFAYRMRLFHCRPGGQPSFARRASSATTTAADAVTARRTAVPLHPACAVGSRENTLTAHTVSVALTRYIPIESGNIRGRARAHSYNTYRRRRTLLLSAVGWWHARARAPDSSAPLSRTPHPPVRPTDRPTDPPRTPLAHGGPVTAAALRRGAVQTAGERDEKGAAPGPARQWGTVTGWPPPPPSQHRTLPADGFPRDAFEGGSPSQESTVAAAAATTVADQ